MWNVESKLSEWSKPPTLGSWDRSPWAHTQCGPEPQSCGCWNSLQHLYLHERFLTSSLRAINADLWMISHFCLSRPSAAFWSPNGNIWAHITLWDSLSPATEAAKWFVELRTLCLPPKEGPGVACYLFLRCMVFLQPGHWIVLGSFQGVEADPRGLSCRQIYPLNSQAGLEWNGPWHQPSQGKSGCGFHKANLTEAHSALSHSLPRFWFQSGSGKVWVGNRGARTLAAVLFALCA